MWSGTLAGFVDKVLNCAKGNLPVNSSAYLVCVAPALFKRMKIPRLILRRTLLAEFEAERGALSNGLICRMKRLLRDLHDAASAPATLNRRNSTNAELVEEKFLWTVWLLIGQHWRTSNRNGND